MTDEQEIQKTFDNSENTQVLTPAGAAVRYPASPTNLTTPILVWEIYNGGAVDIWAAADQTAVVGSVGKKIPPRTYARYPVQTRYYLSVAGGDGSNVDVTGYRYEE